MTVTCIFCLVFLIGIVCGLRSLTGPAVVCWAAHLGWLSLTGSHLSFMGNIVTVIIFSLLAVVELVADKLPKTPPRTQGPGLIARLVTGALCGATLAASGHASLVVGILLGIAGAVAGTFGGYWTRRAATRPGRLPDLPVALLEDLIAIGGGLFLVSRF